MKNYRVLLFGSGSLYAAYCREIQPDDCVIGVDRGAYWLLKHNIVPQMAIGDFDSVNKEQLCTIKRWVQHIVEYSKEKDRTDIDLAIGQALQLYPSEVVVYGALGSRIDHAMSAIQTLEYYKHSSIPIYIKDRNNVIFLCDRRCTLQQNHQYLYISILSITESAVITIAGCKYNIEKTRIFRGSSRGVSNELVDIQGELVVHKGCVLVIRSKD